MAVFATTRLARLIRDSFILTRYQYWPADNSQTLDEIVAGDGCTGHLIGLVHMKGNGPHHNGPAFSHDSNLWQDPEQLWLRYSTPSATRHPFVVSISGRMDLFHNTWEGANAAGRIE